jgi:4-amino-4-deoxy-L-arabinose transferase-like glycosyltransferase
VGYWLAVLVLLLATFLRLWAFNDLPNGLSNDEINTIRLAETARQQGVTILRDDAQGNGREMLYPTLLATTTIVTGNGLIGYRIVSVWVSLLTLSLVFTLGVRLFGRVAGLCSVALLGFGFWSLLLSRSVLVEVTLPLLVALVMLSLARAIPVYRVARQESATTTAFAALGFSVGLGFYVHPMGLLLAMGAMIFIVYTLVTRRPIERQRLSYIGFAVLLMIILTVPYLLFSVNRPDLSAGERIIANNVNILQSIIDGMGGVFYRGDANAIHNIPNNPLLDPISALLVGLGLLIALRSVRFARYTLVLVFLVVLAPSALLTTDSPNFLGLTVWLVPLSLLFGAAISYIYRHLPRLRWVFGGLVLCLLAFIFGTTARDFFMVWHTLPNVQTALRSDLHQLAHYLDRTMDETQTLICYPQFNQQVAGGELSNTQKMFLMMNRRQLTNIRFADCNTALIFTQGGAQEQIIFPEVYGLITMHPYLSRWLLNGEIVSSPMLPEGRVMLLNVEEQLANRVGAFTTIDPTRYGFETAQNTPFVIYPPVRFGGNVTWLGYEPDTNPRYKAGDVVDVINYWRIESNEIPDDLIFFTHILSDPVTVADNRDLIAVDQSLLRERDVFVQVTSIQLQDTILDGTYQISIGAYQQETGARLPVFDENQVRQGDRLILYNIRIGE